MREIKFRTWADNRVTGDVVTFKTKYAGQTCDLARKEIINNQLALKAELVSVNEFKVTALPIVDGLPCATVHDWNWPLTALSINN